MARQTPTVQAALEEYFLTRQHTAKNTQINDRSVLNVFVRSMGDVQVGHLKPQHVERFFLGDGDGAIHKYNARSYNKVRQRVDGFLTFCAARGYNRLPLMLNIRAQRVITRERLQVTPREMLRMLELTADARDRAMLAVSMNLGLRAGEITSLLVQDVELDRGWLRVFVSKSGIADRMPISADLDAELRRWLRVYAAECGGRMTATAHLFPARYGPRFRMMTTPAHPDAAQPGALRPSHPVAHPAVVVQRALKRIGVETEPGEGFHTLRRSAARAFFDSMASKGHDEALRMTSAFLHHSSVQTTEIYLGLQHERLKRDVALRGKPFLTAMLDDSNVLPLPTLETDAATGA